MHASPPDTRVLSPALVRRAGRGDAVPFVVSIDTEEDNWQPARTGITVDNIRELPELQRRLERFGVRATYFTTYQVATHPSSAPVVAELASGNHVEIGGHLHPWNTPPLDEPLVGRLTMLKNLPAPLQAAKLRVLTAALERATGTRPVVFRAGRWGIGPSTVNELAACGYRVDSSVTPFVNWQMYDDGPNHDGAPLGCYPLGTESDVRLPVLDGPVLEVPASFGYTRSPFSFWHRVHCTLTGPRYRWAHLGGVADRAGIFRKAALSPETDSVADMLRLAERLLERDVPYLHMFWHSPSLRPGLSPFVRTQRDVDRFNGAIETFIERLAARVPLRFVTLSEATELLRGSTGPALGMPGRAPATEHVV